MKKITLILFLSVILCSNGFSQIITNNINQTIVGPGQLTFDIDNDSNNDFRFEIITLSQGYAARVVTVGSSYFLDNSTYGYPDALNFNDPVTGYWNTNNGVLGTFTTAGQFNGAGDKYLGIKLGNKLGWIMLNCSMNRDTLIIISSGYQTADYAPIAAGQTVDSTSAVSSIADAPPVTVISDGNVLKINVPQSAAANDLSAKLFDMQGRVTADIKAVQQGENIIDLRGLSHGVYILHIENAGMPVLSQKIAL